MESSFSKDITASVEQLCTQLSIANIVVPRIDQYKDIFAFINEFEMSTAMLPDSQKLVLLVKAFPTGRLKQWYDTSIKPIVKLETWDNIKIKIIQRYSETEDRDRHLKRINTLKFEPDGSQKLFDYVEDLLYSFTRAMPNVDEDTQIRYVKCKLPPVIFPLLSTIANYVTAATIEDFMKVCRRYDILKDEIKNSDNGSLEKTQVEELVAELKNLLKSTKQQQVSQPVRALTPRSQSPVQATPREIARPSYYGVRPNSPSGQSYHTYQYRQPSPYRGQPVQRSPSPARRTVGSNYPQPSYQQHNYSQQNNYQQRDPYPNQERYYKQPMNYQDSSTRPNSYLQYQRGRSPPPRTYPQSPNHMQTKKDSGQVNKITNAFDNERYYQKFGMPPSPCSKCQQMHWIKHCLYTDTLN